MPELAEVEVVRRNLESWWQGRGASQVRLLDEDLLRETEPEDIRQVLSTPLERPERRGKYLLCKFRSARAVVFHFRMTGKIIRCDEPDPKYARLSWYVDGVGWLVFKDQRRLGHARLFDESELDEYEPLQKMGPEPEDVTVAHLRDACSGRRMLKTALMDQSIVAGVGNIAISELFWRLRFSPDVTCGELSDDDLERLVEQMPRYFDEIIEKSMADEVMYVEEAEMTNIFEVYRREGEECPRCGTAIEKRRVGGRTSYFCPRCQG